MSNVGKKGLNGKICTEDYTFKQVQLATGTKTLPLYNQEWNEEKERWEGDVELKGVRYPAASGSKYSNDIYHLFESKRVRDVM